MTTEEFLSLLAPHADLPLAFSAERARVEPAYHVTEIKAVSVDAVAIEADAQVRVEYGGAGEGAVSYLVTAVTASAEGVNVHLTAPAVACKGVDRSVGDIPTVDARLPEVPVLGAASPALGGPGQSCCAPAPSGSRW